ncbi:peptidyl-prolyl cis-trans isomerase Pin1-like [Triticum dicoccoides]|uniref:peptidyl-prolyl cis-trans isomerase Pin1-like n=1 Tax=Triticum dicoccoides TaxID=85692 RepID=UPI00188FE15D|nr:peptidyl-prolyl cis-trans isomerase Pin1-like [Triticum dicoccoides]
MDTKKSFRNGNRNPNPRPTQASQLLCRSGPPRRKMGTDAPAPAPAAAAGDGDAARKRPGGQDAAAGADSKRRRAEHPSSGSRERHGQQPQPQPQRQQRPGRPGDGGKGKRETMRASHILIKHEGSRRKASWRDPDGVAISATTRDDAADLARALRDQIAAGELQFDAAARDNSDCNSAKRGGDLGPFEKGKMQKPFEKAVIALKVGDMSDVVDTESGVHIILRTG